MEPWHANREEVFAVMRQIQDAIDHAWQRSRDLQPRHGCVGIGSADFDYTLKATVGEAYLRALRHGQSPTEAFDTAVADGQDSIKKWNEYGCSGRTVLGGGRYQLHRDKSAAESIALGFHTRFAKWADRVEVPVMISKPTTVRFKSAVIDGSGYCGPTCLSALTGLGTKQIALVLRRQFNMQAVRGLTMDQMKWFIEKAGYRVETVKASETLHGWCSSKRSGVFLIELSDHWLLVNGDKIVCTQFDGAIAYISQSQYLGDRLESVHKITGEPNESAVNALASTKQNRAPAQNQLELFV